MHLNKEWVINRKPIYSSYQYSAYYKLKITCIYNCLVNICLRNLYPISLIGRYMPKLVLILESSQKLCIDKHELD